MTGFSVIVPIGRPKEAERSIRSVLEQQTAREFEVLLVGDAELEISDPRVRTIVVADRNPARRRNIAAGEAHGEILAFLDDDAYARPNWLETAAAIFESRPEVLAAGGPDPAPADSSFAELVSDTLLATPVIGSSVAAHECRRGTWSVVKPHDVALVNLFIRKEAFDAAGGFDESIGYIGEDSALVGVVMRKGTVLYSEHLIVDHRRRAFPSAHLGQRFRYRRKTGRMLVERGRGLGEPKLFLLLAAGFSFLVSLLLVPRIAALLLVFYVAIVLTLSWRVSRLPRRYRLLVPLAFLAHHTTYFAGLVVGMLEGLWRRITR